MKGCTCGMRAAISCIFPEITPRREISGSAAIRDEMIAAQKAGKAYDTAVTAYSECLRREQRAKAAVGGDMDGLADEYSRRTKVEVDKLQKLADKFNSELQAFKARNTGGMVLGRGSWRRRVSAAAGSRGSRSPAPPAILRVRSAAHHRPRRPP